MIHSADELIKRMKDQGITLTEGEISSLREVAEKYPVHISDYYYSLIDWENPECPIRKQCIPDAEELAQVPHYSDDPLHERSYEKVPFLVHKYYSRAAFMCSNICAMNCRHCTRKNTVMNSRSASSGDLQPALDYVKAHPEIRDILITGGDPLAISPDLLEFFLAGFRSVSSVKTIRIGTRIPVTDPDRITEKLADMLAKYHPVWLFLQFNHPKELTEASKKACDILLSRGIPLGNQSVFLKGVNDSEEVLEELYTGLIDMRVRPYYLYLCDRVNGTAHFYADYRRGIELMEKLRYRLPGYAVPKFVIDADGENGGKVTVEKNHILEETDEYLILDGNRENTITKFYL